MPGRDDQVSDAHCFDDRTSIAGHRTQSCPRTQQARGAKVWHQPARKVEQRRDSSDGRTIIEARILLGAARDDGSVRLRHEVAVGPEDAVLQDKRPWVERRKLAAL